MLTAMPELTKMYFSHDVTSRLDLRPPPEPRPSCLEPVIKRGGWQRPSHKCDAVVHVMWGQLAVCDPVYLNVCICCVSSASVPSGSGPARLLTLAEHAGMHTGVLLCDWVAALISCLVIRCVDIRSLLEMTLFKLLPCAEQCCVTSVDCTEGALGTLGTLGGVDFTPFSHQSFGS